MELTWTCHICKRERPDRFMSVHTKAVTLGTGAKGHFHDQHKEELDSVVQNVRYCNDNPKCAELAREYNYFNN